MKARRNKHNDYKDMDEKLLNNYDEKLIEYSSNSHETQSFPENHPQYLTTHVATTQSEVYNPDQDKKEVLEIRKSYAHLREELSSNGRELTKANSQRLSELIDEANFVFGRVHTTFDASLDSRFISDTADLGVEKVHKLPLFVSEFSLDTYLRIVKDYTRTCSWSDMGTLVSSHWSGIETFDYMLGPIDIQKKIKPIASIQPTKKSKMEDAPVVVPSVTKFGNEEESFSERSKETSENVMRLFSILEEVGSFPFYHFITDPHSFARTVENLFYVSFLVKDNRARIFIPDVATETNELFIEALGLDDENLLDDSHSGDFNQMILGMTIKVWQKSIEKYSIKEPFLALS